jgi:hypothetical protein
MREDDLRCLRETYSCAYLRTSYLRGALEQTLLLFAEIRAEEREQCAKVADAAAAMNARDVNNTDQYLEDLAIAAAIRRGA